MFIVYLLLLVAALVCFLIAAVSHRTVGDRRPIDLVALGLAFWVLVAVIQAFARV